MALFTIYDTYRYIHGDSNNITYSNAVINYFSLCVYDNNINLKPT